MSVFFYHIDELNAFLNIYFLIMLIYHVFKAGIILTSVFLEHVHSVIDVSDSFI